MTNADDILTFIEDDWTPPDTVSRNLKEILWFGMDDGQVYTSHIEVIDPDESNEERWGILSFEEFYGDLSFSIQETLEKHFPDFGYFRMEGADMAHGQDSWTGEGWSEFYPGEIRPATLSEIREYFGEKITPLVFWDQLKAAFCAARHMENF